MKAKRIVSALLLVVLIVSSALLVVACQKKEKSFRSDMLDKSQWRNLDKDIYTFENDSNGNLLMSYDKTDTHQIAMRTMSEKVEDLDKVKTLVITVSSQTNAGEPNINLKFEGGEGTPEINFAVTSEAKTYEWDVSEFQLGTRTRLLLFADMGWIDVQGKLTISEFYFTSEPINEANKIVPYQEPASNPPTNVEWSEITAEDPAVDAGWYDGGHGVYTVTQNADSTFKVEASKGKHDRYRYDAIWAYLYGDNEVMKTFKSFKLTVKGAQGTLFGVKPFDEGALEVKKIIEQDNVEQTIWVDITSYFTAKDSEGNVIERNFAKTTDATDAKGENKIGIFWQTGSLGVEGEFTIVSAEFSTEAAPIDYNVKEITAADKKADAGWYDNGDGAYTITANDDGSYKVVYDKGSSGWAYLTTYVKGAALADMKTITVKVKGESGLRMLVKPYDKVECWIDLDGTEQTETFDISADQGVDYSASKLPINVFLAPDTADLKGEFTIYSIEFSTEKMEEEVPATSYVENLNVSVNSWIGMENEHIKFEQRDNNWVAKFTGAENEYGAAIANVKLGDHPANYLVLEVKGTKGAHAIFKFGGFEYKFDDGTDYPGAHFADPFTGEWQTAVIKLETPVTGDTQILLMAGFKSNTDAGEVEIRKAQLYYVTSVSDDDLDVNGCWLGANDSGHFTIANADGKTTVSCSAPGWDSILAWVDLGEGGYSKLTITFKGLAGHTGIFKFNTTEIKFEGNAGDKGTFTGEEQTIEFDASGLSGVIEFRIFFDMNPNEVNAQGGSLEITQAVFSK